MASARALLLIADIGGREGSSLSCCSAAKPPDTDMPVSS